MKLLITALFTFMSLSVFADCVRESEFIGKVKNISISSDSFKFQIKAGRHFRMSSACSQLDENELESIVFELPGTPLVTEGSEVSGVVLFNEQNQKYEIESRTALNK
jgi:hypothetical protein